MPGPYWLQYQALNPRQGLQGALSTGDELSKVGQGIA